MDKKSLIWAYVIEALAAVLLFVVAYVFGGENFLKFSEKLVDVMPKLMTAFLAIVVAAWFYWGGIQRSALGKYLNYNKADWVYTTAYCYQTTVFVVLLVISYFGNSLPNWGMHVLCILFLYGVINMWTIIRNTWWLMKLNSRFQAEYDN